MNTQKLSLGLNLVLLVAVVVLFIKVFGGSSETKTENHETGTNETVNNNEGDSSVKVNTVHKEDGVLTFAFVNVDSLNSGYTLLKDAEVEFQALTKQGEAQMKAKVNAFQQRGRELEKDFPIMTLSQQKAAQEEMQKMEKDLQTAEERIFGPIQEKFAKQKADIDRTLRNFLRELCIRKNIDFVLGDISQVNLLLYANPAMDITQEVLDGLNKEYEETKK